MKNSELTRADLVAIEKNPTNETARIEALSDSMFAFSITLLVLNIHVPAVTELRDNVTLFDLLIRQWPIYFSYLVSFFTIGIMWLGHRVMFRQAERSNNTLAMVNLFLMMGITLVPFTTSLLAEQLQGRDARIALMVYTIISTVVAVLFNITWRCVSHLNPPTTPHDREVQALVNRRYSLTPWLSLLSVILSAFSLGAGLFMYGLLVVYYGYSGISIGLVPMRR